MDISNLVKKEFIVNGSTFKLNYDSESDYMSIEFDGVIEEVHGYNISDNRIVFDIMSERPYGYNRKYTIIKEEVGYVLYEGSCKEGILTYVEDV